MFVQCMLCHNRHKQKRNANKCALFSSLRRRHLPCLVSSSSAAFIPQLVLATSLLSLNGTVPVSVLLRILGSQLDSFLSYGPLIRCDVPAPRNPSAHSNPYVPSILGFSLLFRCSATSAIFAAHSPVVSARTRMHASFHFDSSAVVFPRHSISRRVRTKAQHPSTVAVTHSLSFAAPAMPRMPTMTCMSHFQPFLLSFHT